jgi:hypothetical protein
MASILGRSYQAIVVTDVNFLKRLADQIPFCPRTFVPHRWAVQHVAMIAPIEAYDGFHEIKSYNNCCDGSDLSISSRASTLRALLRAKSWQCAKLWLQQKRSGELNINIEF